MVLNIYSEVYLEVGVCVCSFLNNRLNVYDCKSKREATIIECVCVCVLIRHTL